MRSLHSCSSLDKLTLLSPHHCSLEQALAFGICRAIFINPINGGKWRLLIVKIRSLKSLSPVTDRYPRSSSTKNSFSVSRKATLCSVFSGCLCDRRIAVKGPLNHSSHGMLQRPSSQPPTVRNDKKRPVFGQQWVEHWDLWYPPLPSHQH